MPERACEHCGTALKSHHPKARFCIERACQSEKMRRYFVDYTATHGEAYTARYRTKRSTDQREWRQRTGYKARESSPAAARASDALRRARKRGVDAELFDPVEVFDRDGWTCGICDAPVDADLAWPDLMSASLDHVIPLSLDGPHTRANTRCAHLECNVRRGNRIDVAA